MTKKKPLVLGLVATVVAGLGLTLTQTASGTTQETGTAATSPQSPMTFVTANIGRSYGNKATKVCHRNAPEDAMNQIRNKLSEVADGKPRFIGWQEIDENDCASEMEMLKDAFPTDKGWERTLTRVNPDGKQVPLKVPTTAHDATISGQQVRFGSKGFVKRSPTRFITITRYRGLNVSHINTHFIAGAFKDCKECAKYRKAWSAHWGQLKKWAAEEHKADFNVVVTADWNRHSAKAENQWQPDDLHDGAKLVQSSGLDHIVALPARGQKAVRINRGSWPIGIDTHSAQWVKLRFSKS